MAERGSAEQRQRRRKHVFVINNSPSFLSFMRALLREEDYNVTTTNYLPSTWEQIKASQPDLLVIDLDATHESWPLLERLSRETMTRSLPILVTSTLSEHLARVEEAERFGARLIAKPFDLEVILQAVNEMIGEA